MTGQLADVLKSLLTTSLPGHFGGGAPAVQLSLVPDAFTIDPQSIEADAGEPRVDDQTDNLAFNAATPHGPFTLTRPPQPGPKRIWLTTPVGDRIIVMENEIVWDPIDSKTFTLQLRADRDLTGIHGLEVLYGVVAVFIKIKALQSLFLQLQCENPAKLEEASNLAIAIIELNRKRIADQSGSSSSDGVYGAAVAIRSLKLLSGVAPSATIRQLAFTAEVELKGTRVLGANEGAPIVSIVSPGRASTPKFPIAVEIGVSA